MSTALDALKAQFVQEEETAQKRTNGGTNTEWYPFWKMDFDETAIVRFLPDADATNTNFVIEKFLHKLDVEIDGKEQRRQVPCLSMFGKPCPICQVSQKFYKEDDDVNGSKFWKKKSYLAQIMVLDSPFDLDAEEDGSINPHKLINLEPKIYEKIKKAIMQGDLDEMPTDYAAGYDFRLNKTKDGKWASFSTSSFKPRSSELSVDPKSLTLYTLKAKLPREPDLEYVEAVLHSALTGEPFTYKKAKGEGTAPSAVTTAPIEVKEEPEAAKQAESNVMDIINSRRNAGK